MSSCSTQWGKVETGGDEGAVSGYTCGAWATACALLWACGGLCKGRIYDGPNAADFLIMGGQVKRWVAPACRGH